MGCRRHYRHAWMTDGKFEKVKVNLLKVPARSCPITAIVSRGKKQNNSEGIEKIFQNQGDYKI